MPYGNQKLWDICVLCISICNYLLERDDIRLSFKLKTDLYLNFQLLQQKIFSGKVCRCNWSGKVQSCLKFSLISSHGELCQVILHGSSDPVTTWQDPWGGRNSLPPFPCRVMILVIVLLLFPFLLLLKGAGDLYSMWPLLWGWDTPRQSITDLNFSFSTQKV